MHSIPWTNTQSQHDLSFVLTYSNTGQDPPESCVFTFVCAIGTILSKLSFGEGCSYCTLGFLTSGNPGIFNSHCECLLPLALVIVCLRYKHLHHYYHSTVPWMHCTNVFSAAVGLLSALGLLLVGSFQVQYCGSTHGGPGRYSAVSLPCF